MLTYLQALSLASYRGIDEEQVMTGFGNFNFFIGANNSGKSTVLNFISRYLPIKKGTQAIRGGIDALERHGGLASAAIQFRIGFSTQQTRDSFYRRYPFIHGSGFYHVSEMLFNHIDDGGYIWLNGTLPHQDKILSLNFDVDALLRQARPADLSHLHALITTGGSRKDFSYQIYVEAVRDHDIPNLFGLIQASLSIDNIPDTKLIPAIRQIGPRAVSTHSGSYPHELK